MRGVHIRGAAAVVAVVTGIAFGVLGSAGYGETHTHERLLASPNSCAVAQAKGGHSFDRTDCAEMGPKEEACWKGAGLGTVSGGILRDPRSMGAGAISGCVSGVANSK